MNYTNGFAKDDFFQFMYTEYPNAYSNPHSRDLLENIVDYCTEDNFTHTKNVMFYTLEQLIPEIKANELLNFFDKKVITQEVITYCQQDNFKEVTSLKELQEAIEEIGWNIEDCSYSDDSAKWEISQYSPAGEDFVFYIEHNGDINIAIREINEYAINFDVDEHIEMWIKARHNVEGVPSASKLVKDAIEIQEMLDKLADYCINIQVYTEKNDKEEILESEELEEDEPDL